MAHWLRKKLWVPLAVAPILAKLTAHKIDLPFVWPPIGDFESLLSVLASAAVALCGVLPAKLKTKEIAARNMKISIRVGFVFLIAYGILVFTVVVPKHTPKNGTRYITTGFIRTDLANRKFPNATRDELIEDTGLEEGDIEKVWTSGSILLAKALLYVSYLGAMSSFNYAIGAHTRSAPQSK